MFDFGPAAVRSELPEAFTRAWEEIAGPGAWWTGAQRVAIALAARGAFAGHTNPPDALSPPAVEACELLTCHPAETTQAWVERMSETLGVGAYVELVGIVARVSAVDTFCRLSGHPLVDFPPARDGEPSEEPMPAKAKRRNTWVPMVALSPPFVLGAVPSAEHALLDIIDPLYMTLEQMLEADFARGSLHRTQIELVAGTVSYANECFY